LPGSGGDTADGIMDSYLLGTLQARLLDYYDVQMFGFVTDNKVLVQLNALEIRPEI